MAGAETTSADPNDARGFLAGELRGSREALARAMADETLIATLDAVATAVVGALSSGGKVLFCGNGGSAADSQHLAAELVGRQNFDRAAAAGIALTVDTSALTAIGNDYGYDQVFSRQVDALGRPGDLLVGLSTSGRSRNVVAALRAAAARGLTTVAMTGAEPRDMGFADHVVAVPATETAHIQECHIACGHAIFALAERTLFTPPRPAPDAAAPLP